MAANPNKYKLSERTGKLTAAGKSLMVIFYWNIWGINDRINYMLSKL